MAKIREAEGTPRAVDGLIEEARRGSREALGEVIDAFRSQLALAARRELGRDLWAKASPSDVVQETLLKAQRDFEDFRGMTEHQLRAWLLVILRRSVLEARRRFDCQGRDVGHEAAIDGVRLPSHSTSPSGKAIGREEAALLAEALGRLSARDRLVVTWRHEEGSTFEEIGRRLGCSLVAARAAWLRALEHLRKELVALSAQSSMARPARVR